MSIVPNTCSVLTRMSGEESQTPPSVYEHLAMVLDQIATVSWQKLGLQPDIISGTTELNLAEAKVAIDVVGFIADKVQPQLDEDDRKTVQNLVTNLRLNYVQKSREAEN